MPPGWFVVTRDYHILINAKESYLVVTRHVSWAQNIAQMLQPLGQLTLLPEKPLQPEREGKSMEKGTGRAEKGMAGKVGRANR